MNWKHRHTAIVVAWVGYNLVQTPTLTPAEALGYIAGSALAAGVAVYLLFSGWQYGVRTIRQRVRPTD